MTKNIPELFKDSLHENYNDLIGVWVWQGLSVSLDNWSDNIAKQIVNVTKGVTKSLLWIDKSAQRRIEKLIGDAIKRGDANYF